MRTTPDRVEEIKVGDVVVEVKIYTMPTDWEWDGDFELEPGSEGWDAFVEVEAYPILGMLVTACSSCCGYWFLPNQEGRAGFDEFVEGVKQEAIDEFRRELKAYSNPSRPEAARAQAEREMLIAKQMLANMGEEK